MTSHFKQIAFPLLSALCIMLSLSYGFYQSNVRVHLISHEHTIVASVTKTHKNTPSHSHHDHGHGHSHDTEKVPERESDSDHDPHSITDHLVDYNLQITPDETKVPTTTLLVFVKIEDSILDHYEDDLTLLYQARAPPTFS